MDKGCQKALPKPCKTLLCVWHAAPGTRCVRSAFQEEAGGVASRELPDAPKIGCKFMTSRMTCTFAGMNTCWNRTEFVTMLLHGWKPPVLTHRCSMQWRQQGEAAQPGAARCRGQKSLAGPCCSTNRATTPTCVPINKQTSALTPPRTSAGFHNPPGNTNPCLGWASVTWPESLGQSHAHKDKPRTTYADKT